MLAHQVVAVAAVRGTSIDEVDNVCNAELLSRASQTTVLARMNVTARVLVNGV